MVKVPCEVGSLQSLIVENYALVGPYILYDNCELFHRKVAGKRYTNVRDMLADMLDEKTAGEIMARKDNACKSPSTCTE